MSKNLNTSSLSNETACSRSIDTDVIDILIKKKLIDSNTIKISIWDYDYEIGTIIYPLKWHKINDLFDKILDAILIGYSNSSVFDEIQKRKAGAENEPNQKLEKPLIKVFTKNDSNENQSKNEN